MQVLWSSYSFLYSLYAPPSSIKKPIMNQYLMMQSRVGVEDPEQWQQACLRTSFATHWLVRKLTTSRATLTSQGLLDLLTSCWPPPTRKWQRNLHSSSIFHSGKKLESFNGGFFLGFPWFKHHSCSLLLLLFVEQNVNFARAFLWPCLQDPRSHWMVALSCKTPYWVESLKKKLNGHYYAEDFLHVCK